MRATPEPDVASLLGIGGQVTNATQGQRTRSTRRRHARPGRQRKAATGGRGLDIPGIQKPDGQQ